MPENRELGPSRVRSSNLRVTTSDFFPGHSGFQAHEFSELRDAAATRRAVECHKASNDDHRGFEVRNSAWTAATTRGGPPIL